MTTRTATLTLLRPPTGRARVPRFAAVVLLATVLTAAVATPAGATEDLTGDITPPEIASLELQPAAVDVTDGSATVVVTGRFTDAGTGVTGGVLSWKSPAEDSHSYGTHFTRVSGTDADGVYRASMTIPHGAAPGQWPLELQVRDRVGNVRVARAADLELAALPGHLDVASAHPDVTAPDVVALEVLPAEVDVRSGPGSVTVRVHVVDDASGVQGLFVPPTGPHGFNGGAHVPVMQLVSGSPTDGWWEGELRVDEHAHAGMWTFAVRANDVLFNAQDFPAEDLAARGMSAQFGVLSHEDVTPPAFPAASLSAIALDVSDSDQQVAFSGTVTDDLAGVEDYSWGLSNVQLSFRHPLGQLVGQAGMPRTSGTAHDGEYAATLTFPRHSATGLWTVHLSSTDRINNSNHLGPVQLADLGLPPAVLVYNTPLPPLDVDVDPGDAAALVQWQPPSDERGADVTEYVVRELPQGVTVTVDADSRSALVPGLENGVEHSFVVHAVNRAGESDPSQNVAAVPADGLTLEPEPSGASVTRLSGADRLDTAIAVSRDAFADGSAAAVVLSRSDDYADALSGTPLAASLGAPLLITPGAQMHAAVLQEVQRVLPPGGTIHLLGGERALSPAVATSLLDAGYVVERHAGSDRYATSVVIARRTTASPRAVLLATGRSFADALGAGAAAAGAGGVVVLTDGTRLPAVTADYLSQQHSVPRYAIGGPASTAVPDATRIVGADRYATAVLTAEQFPGQGAAVGLATGDRFPDALAGGAHAARLGAPLLLTPSTGLAPVVSDHLSASVATKAYVYGGESAVSEPVRTRVVELLAR